MLTISCLVLQKLSAKKNQSLASGKNNIVFYGFEIIVASTNIMDLKCGVYLVILWVADLYFYRNFSVKEKYWRSHPICFTSFGILTNFSLLSPLLLCFVSLSRFMIVAHPIDPKYKKSKNIIIVIFCLLFICVLPSLVLTMQTYQTKSILPMSLCSPFVDPSDSFTVVFVVTLTIVVEQCAACIAIGGIYLALLLELNKSKKSLSNSTSMHKSNVGLIAQVVVISASNIVCWIPSGIIYLLSLFLEKYPVDVVIWATIVMTPINSVINPTVFAVTTFRKIRKKGKGSAAKAK